MPPLLVLVGGLVLIWYVWELLGARCGRGWVRKRKLMEVSVWTWCHEERVSACVHFSDGRTVVALCPRAASGHYQHQQTPLTAIYLVSRPLVWLLLRTAHTLPWGEIKRKAWKGHCASNNTWYQLFVPYQYLLSADVIGSGIQSIEQRAEIKWVCSLIWRFGQIIFPRTKKLAKSMRFYDQ